MKTWTFKVTVTEGGDSWWEELQENEEVLDFIREILNEACIDAEVTLVSFKEDF